MKYRYYGISLSIHLILLLLLVLPNRATPPPKKEQKDKMIDIQVVEVEKKKVEKIEFEEEEMFAPIPMAKQEQKPCKSHYEGIGITSDFSPMNGFQRIDTIHSGYPAEHYGLQEGDLIKSLYGESIRGKAGTVLVLEVIRNGEYLTLEVVRGEICYEDI